MMEKIRNFFGLELPPKEERTFADKLINIGLLAVISASAIYGLEVYSSQEVINEYAVPAGIAAGLGAVAILGGQALESRRQQ